MNNPLEQIKKLADLRKCLGNLGEVKATIGHNGAKKVDFVSCQLYDGLRMTWGEQYGESTATSRALSDFVADSLNLDFAALSAALATPEAGGAGEGEALKLVLTRAAELIANESPTTQGGTSLAPSDRFHALLLALNPYLYNPFEGPAYVIDPAKIPALSTTPVGGDVVGETIAWATAEIAQMKAQNEAMYKTAREEDVVKCRHNSSRIHALETVLQRLDPKSHV